MPKASEGTDHLNNLYAAHIKCNRSKQDRWNRAVRTMKANEKDCCLDSCQQIGQRLVVFHRFHVIAVPERIVVLLQKHSGGRTPSLVIDPEGCHTVSQQKMVPPAEVDAIPQFRASSMTHGDKMVSKAFVLPGGPWCLQGNPAKSA